MNQKHQSDEIRSTNSDDFASTGLGEKTLRACSAMGYVSATPVQREAIPHILAGRDVLAAAQTGTGKTAAFLLPTMDRLGHARRGGGPLMLVITPTRELAQQIEAVAKAIAHETGHRICTLVGGVSYEPQRQALRRGCDVLVATPGRLEDLIAQGDAKLGEVQALVLDEADRMLDMGFLPAVRRIVGKTPADRQTMLFSATLDDEVLEHTGSLVNEPARVEIAHKGTAAETIDQYVMGVSPEAKNGLLIQILKREGAERVIVFTRGKHRADGICKRLRRAGIEAAPIHGNRSQNQRESALRRFRSGEVGVMVATDVLARGIDIPEVAYVVNFDVPGDAEDYIHRIGRTGRAGETGWALTMVTEDDYLDLRDAEKLMGRIIPAFPRTDGLDLGANPVQMDPDRSPNAKLPGKKARRKMQEERSRKREKARQALLEAEAQAAADAKAAKGGKPAAKSAKATRSARPTKPALEAKVNAANEKRQEGRKPKRSNASGAHARKASSGAGKNRKSIVSAKRHSSAVEYGPGKKPTTRIKRGTRRVGDRGGRA